MKTKLIAQHRFDPRHKLRVEQVLMDPPPADPLDHLIQICLVSGTYVQKWTFKVSEAMVLTTVMVQGIAWVVEACNAVVGAKTPCPKPGTKSPTRSATNRSRKARPTKKRSSKGSRKNSAR